VYFGKDFQTSAGYAQRRGGVSAWPNSIEAAILGRNNAPGGTAAGTRNPLYTSSTLSSMLICEIALTPECKDHPSCYVHTNEDAITSRYLLKF